ncbi:MAG: polyhydroxyalkanoate depolymerase, partial [Alphaproteobacteria bacterium]
MLYHLYELTHAAITPLRAAATLGKGLLDNPLNPAGYTVAGRATAAALEIFERTTRRYGRPGFDIDHVTVGGRRRAVREEVVHAPPFCELRRFTLDDAPQHEDGPRPRLLVVAPMSGHFATLLRGTVAAMLRDCDVYVTDWADARTVPASAGDFDLDDYIDYVADFLRFIGPGTHVMAVCQPGPAVLAATALMADDDDPCRPRSMTLMGSPIDPRRSPTAPNRLAMSRPLDWFERNVIVNVPFPHPGFGRRVYPGFLQLTGFMTMNLDRHIGAHVDLYRDLVRGDGDSAGAHRKFYDEYLSVMDLTAAFYLQTMEVVFQKAALARGEMVHRGRRVDPAAIRDVALMTVEGEKDDISGIGQTQAAHDLCVNI